MKLTLDKNDALPLYEQLYRQLRARILDGRLPSGEKLPPSRQLARACGVARITVTEAYERLAAEGFVVGHRGAGTFVAKLPEGGTVIPPGTAVSFTPPLTDWGQRLAAARLPESPPGPRPPIDFGFGRSFPHIFPYDIWRKLLARYLSTDDVMLSRYGSAAGFAPLRAALADYLGRWRGVRCTPEQVVIVSGAQQAVDILARLLLSPGDEVLVETPGYTAVIDLLRLYGTAIRPLPVDDQGFPVALIPPESRARLAFVTPSNQFPRGGTMPLARRLALLAWARETGTLVVEDDYDGELRYDGRPLSALQGLDKEGRVVYLGTFSKVLFPALRLGYVALPEPLLEPFIRAKGLVDRGAPTLTQAAVADFITEGHFERHLRHLRQAYGRRRKVLVGALREFMPDGRFTDNPAGLQVMVYLPDGVSEADVIRRAAQAGVGVYPGAAYHVGNDGLWSGGRPSMLLGFSGLTEEEIEKGIQILGEVVAKQNRSR